MKDFDNWNENKKQIESSSINRNFREKEVWFINMGLNVGYEQDGKGEEYLRPVVVLKKFNKMIFLGVPLTKIKKDRLFYCTFKFKGGDSTAILSQVRLFDSKRLKFRYGKVSSGDFDLIKRKLTDLIR
ncbi:MAG: type II toxin-antitoxin system PemK/MazF family toxin [Candidatus Pacebacteria bacterium]|nr:type II toxin-antitoxin system PemK/MazF family toxin [Candidatus Paceibacterota bacterium]